MERQGEVPLATEENFVRRAGLTNGNSLCRSMTRRDPHRQQMAQHGAQTPVRHMAMSSASASYLSPAQGAL